MRQKLLMNCAAAALAASLGATAWAGNTADSSQPQAKSSPAQAQEGKDAGKMHRQSAQAPEGYVLIEENTVYLMANEPQQHLLQAHADLARQDDRGAAEETRLAAAFLDMQSARHGDNQDQDLKKQSDHLRHVAGELEQGKTKVSVEHLDRDFARASDALAKHYDALAKYDLQKQRFIAAGYDLRATANAFENTLAWGNQKPSADDQTMIRNAREIAANLRGNDVYQGEKALKSEQKAWDNKEDKSGKEKTDEAQTANARLPANGGATPAAARNDAQHAEKMADALGQAIDKCAGMIDQNKSGAAEHQEKGATPAQKENASSGKAGNASQSH